MKADAIAVINDFHASCEHLTSLGKEIVREACAPIHDLVLRVAQAKGWAVIDYYEYSDWCQEIVRHRPHLILDPIYFQGRRSLGHTLRIVRVTDKDRDVPESVSSTGQPSDLSGKHVMIVDDAVATGSTVQHAASYLTACGATVSQVVACTITALGRAALGHAFPHAIVSQFVAGNVANIHMRDACPYFPFSGRPHRNYPVIHTAAGPVETRIPSFSLRSSSVWSLIYEHPSILKATNNARREIAQRMSSSLGRQATVLDLKLLGQDVAVPAYLGQTVTPSSTLESISWHEKHSDM